MSTMHFTFRLGRFFALLLIAATSAIAQVEGPGGHFYKVIIEPGLSWEEAKNRAAESTFNGVHGHLATVTSAEEDELIESLRKEAAPGGYGSLWVGGSQLPGTASPTENWFWINGEGPIAGQNGGPGYSNWQTGEPNDYWGPQSENFLSVGHFNAFGWNDGRTDPNHSGYVIEYSSRGSSSTVRISTVDPVATELEGDDSSGIWVRDSAVFKFSRDGDLSLDLPVFYSIHGTAKNGADYNEIPKSIIIPAGESSARVEIVPRADALAVVEPMETVGIRVEPSLVLNPSAGYRIDPDHREAAAVIYEARPPQNGAIEIAMPGNGATYPFGEPITILAAVYSTSAIGPVDFYSGDLKIGSVPQSVRTNVLSFFQFTWSNAPAGSNLLSARTSGTNGQFKSSSIPITVQENTARPEVGIRFVPHQTTEPWPDADFAPGFLEVFRYDSTAQNLQIFYSVSGTATANVDYEALQGYVVIGAGRTSAKITVVALDDQIDETNETVVVTLVPSGTHTNSNSEIVPSQYVIDSDYRWARVEILDNDDAPEFPMVSIAAVSAHTSEPIPNALVAPGVFRIFRSGPTNQPLVVSMKYEGTATPNLDYIKLPDTVTIPGGKSESDLIVLPQSDDLVEGAETVIALLNPIRGPYNINESRQRATVIIQDYEPGDHPRITITAPQSGEHFRIGGNIQIQAAAVDPNSYMSAVEFYANETKIGDSVIQFVVAPPPGTPVNHEFLWQEVPAGDYNLTVRGVSSKGFFVVSNPVRIQVDGTNDHSLPRVSIWTIRESTRESGPTEDVAPGVFAVRRTGSTSNSLAVFLSYSGTATINSDYVNPGQVVEFKTGQSEVRVNVIPNDDNLVESNETVVATLVPSGPRTNGTSIVASQYDIDPEHRFAQVVILDNDGPSTLPVITIISINPETREPGPTERVAPAVFAVRRTGSTSNALAVYLSYAGTATINSDYDDPGRFVEFKTGQSEIRVDVIPHDDNLVEGDETIIVSLAASPLAVPPQYQIGPTNKSVTLTIHDNDPAPVQTKVWIETIDPQATEFPPNTKAFDPASFRLSRVGDITPALTVFLSLHGTAENGEDYQTISNWVTIPAGTNSVEIEVIPLWDREGIRHHYEIVSAPGISWEEARKHAANSMSNGVAGHLATITSAREDEHIESLRQEAGGAVLWVGGYQEPGELSVTEGWKWLNSEGPIPGTNSTTGYVNWLPGEPNDYWGPSSENQMVIGWLNTFGWNDQGANIGAQGYVIEYDIPTPIPFETELMETVAIRIEESDAASPLATYLIDSENRVAAAVIFDRQPPTNGEVEVAFPSAGFVFQRRGDVEFLVAGYHPSIDILSVEFFVDEQKVGSSEIVFDKVSSGGLIFHDFKWTAATPGRHILQAKAPLNGRVLSSSKIPFVVESDGANQNPIVILSQPEDGAVFVKGEPIKAVAKASDSDGTIARIELIMDGNIIATTHPTNANATSISFIITNASLGAHVIFARAFDNLGAFGVSQSSRILVRHPDTVAFVQRQLPESYAPGAAFTVELRADPPDGTHAYAVEDRPPAGWLVSAISHEGVFDSVTRKVKFGPFTDASSRTLTYRVTPPANASGRFEFTGSSSINGAIYPITGDYLIELVHQFHPADQNQNFAIILGEVTAYAAAWKAGEAWPTGPVPIPVSYVTSAATIWKRGEVYGFDPTRGPAPACWVPGTNSGPRAMISSAESITPAERIISGELRAGVSVRIQITATPAPGTTSYALEEKPPRGWTISNISNEGTFDAASGTIRWGVFVDSSSRTLTYDVTPPAAVSGVGVFTGQISFDGKLAEISSSRSVSIDGTAPIHITNCLRTSAGVSLHVSGPAGQTAVIEVSEDFINWTELKSIFIPNGSIELTPDLAPSNGNRFYRLRVQ